MRKLLENKTALVTGASRGIGRATATTFAREGAYVGVNYRSNDSAAQETLKMVQQHSDGMLLQADVSREGEVKSIIEKLNDERGAIDIVVNNAGIYKRATVDQKTLEDWHKVLEVNLTGSYLVAKHALPHVPDGGRLIFISSQRGFKGSPHGADYAASKAGVLGLMRSLARELAKRNITSNAVAPGTIDTDMIAGLSGERRQKYIRRIPMKRLGEPEEIADACLYLASDMASYVTGETINVNGGLYIH
ncbi:MAG: 3-oxoacyl-ACP reductase family protein [Thermoplasmatota archaeon]